MPRGGIIGLQERCVFYFIRNYWTVFQSGLLFYSNSAWNFISLLNLGHILVVSLYCIVALICLSQINTNIEHFFCILIGHLDIFFGEVSVQDFWPSFLFWWTGRFFLFLIDFHILCYSGYKTKEKFLKSIRKYQTYH